MIRCIVRMQEKKLYTQKVRALKKADLRRSRIPALV